MGKRLALTVTFLGLSVVALVVGSQWHFVVARYHCWRLSRAETIDESARWLEALIADMQTPAVSAVVASQLGPKNPLLTFRVFDHLRSTSRDDSSKDDLFPSRLGRMLPLIQALERRVQADEKLLAYFAHFVRWAGSETWLVLNGVAEAPKRPGLIEVLLGGAFYAMVGPLDFSEKMLDFIRREPEAFEAGIRLMHLQLLAEAWILGMSPLPRPPSFKVPTTKAELKQRANSGKPTP